MEAGNCPHAEFQEFWEKLNCDTDVIWAAGCDDYLRMKSAFKMSLKVTQTMVDRNIMVRYLQNIATFASADFCGKFYLAFHVAGGNYQVSADRFAEG